jgi:outer membrane lipoprotein-sorting protein
MSTRRLHLCAPLLLLVVLGCRNQPSIPTYPRMPTTQATQIVRDRAHAIRSVSAEGLLTLTRPDGESVRLDAALAMSPPDKLRLRAWKFGQAVFDLTLNPDGVWLITPDDSSRKAQLQSAGLTAAKLARTWSLLAGSYFDSPNLQTEDRGATLIVRRTDSDGTHLIAQVDTATLTVQRYTLAGPDGQQHFTLNLDHYIDHGARLVWPHHLLATSDSGTIEVSLRDVELNTDLPLNAFTPPRRAEKLP